MSNDSEYNQKSHHPSELVTTREAVAFAPNLSRDYIARLVRDGLVAGTRIDTGHWLVNVASLQNFLQTKTLEETVRTERTRFERLQEQELQLFLPPAPVRGLVIAPVQSLAVLASGLLVGVFLFLGGMVTSSGDDVLLVIAEALSTEQTASVAVVTSTRVAVAEEFQVSGGYVEIIYLSATGQESVLFQSTMEQESTDVIVGLSPKEVKIAVAPEQDRARPTATDVSVQLPFVMMSQE